MKTKIIAATIFLAGAIPHASHGLSNQCFATACLGTNYSDITNGAANCIHVSRTCYCDEAVATCTSCKSGYTRKEDTVRLSTGGTSKYYYCEQNCTGCSNCTSDSDWSAGNTGYQKKTTRTCSCNTCNEITTYRCAPGYYGTSTNGTSGCTICPTANSMTGTSAAGSTSQTSCYIPSDTSNNDSAGIFTFTENCYYSN